MERVGGFVELFTQKVPAVCARQKTILPPQAVPLPFQGRLIYMSLRGVKRRSNPIHIKNNEITTQTKVCS